MASEKGASIWLTSLPLEEFGFSLHKRAFADAIALRYGWTPPNLPTRCGCGVSFSVEHTLSCPKGGFPTIRHNQLKNMTASLLTEVCHDIEIEPHLQPTSRDECPNPNTNISDGARLDVSMNRFWAGQYEKAFLDVRVFNPYANSYKNIEIDKCYKKHELEKKKLYEERVLNVEHSTFTPLVFSVAGGMSRECTLFFKRLASLIAEKRDQLYSQTLGWLRCCTSFALLRSCIQCIRGARSSINKAVYNVPIDLVNTESDIKTAH